MICILGFILDRNLLMTHSKHFTESMKYSVSFSQFKEREENICFHYMFSSLRKRAKAHLHYIKFRYLCML